MSPVDDVILNGQAPKKKKGKGILVVLFLLFLILIALGGVYWYFINYMQETPKTIFFKHVGQSNFNNILNTDIYYTMLEKMNEQSYKTETTANVTTTNESEYLNGVDVSKLEFILNSTSDKENETSWFDAKINYSSNDLFNLKLISTENSIGIGSTEILDKYVATSKSEYSNSIKRATGFETDISSDIIDEKINNISSNRINLTEEYKSQKVNEYSQLIYNLIPEEAVTENENVVVTVDSKTINTKAYTLNIDSNKYKEIVSSVLTNLKNDNELLGKIVTGTKKEAEVVEEVEEVQNSTENTINPLTNVQVEYTEAETEQHQTEFEVTNNDETEDLEIVKQLPDENLVKEENVVEENGTSEVLTGETDTNSELFKNLILAFVFNQKIEGTTEDLIKEINLELANIDNINEGVKITVYVRNEEQQAIETIKLVIELPNRTSVDIEYQDENKSKITYLEEVEGNENINTEGTSIEIERTISDINTKLDIQVNNIKNKKVIAKTQVELETEGSKSSKDYTNEAIIKYNNSEGDFKLNIKNKIDFSDVKVEEALNDENAIFIDKLTDEEVTNLYTEITQKIIQVYSEKMISLNFIDNSLSSSIIQQPTTEEDKSVIRQKLIDIVSNMMGEAQQNGTTFTIQDLQNLQIEGLNVSCIVTEELATIKINGYTFKIDKNFMLSE